MRIKFLTSIASKDWAYAPGQIAFVETGLAQKWIASGIAVSLEPKTGEARPEQKPADTPKLRSQQLREEIEQARHTLERKRAELADTRDAVEGAQVDAILSGKKSRAPGLLSKVRELESQIEELESSLAPLERACSSVKRDEAEAANRAGEALCAELRVEHRAAVATLIEAIESGDPMAAPRISEAEMAIASIWFKFPEGKRPAQIVVRNPSMITLDPPMRMFFFEQLCGYGFSDLFAKDHLARRRYEHQRAHDQSEYQRSSRERARRAVIADASVISDERPTSIPDRRKPMVYL